MTAIAKVLVLSLAAVLVGCASAPPTADELAKADYGAPIEASAVRAKAQEYVENQLKDPASVQYKWGDVQQGWLRSAPFEGNKLTWGYLLDVDVNAKNSYGAYAGYKTYLFLFRNGKMIWTSGPYALAYKTSWSLQKYGP